MTSNFFKKVFPHLFVLLALCLTMGLAIWQLQRMTWKEDLINKLESRLEMTPIKTSEFKDFDEHEFRLVSEIGKYDHANEMQILHQTYNGKVGTHIITPFIADSGKTVLVNRGWVPYETEYESPSSKTELYGIIRRNSDKGHFALKNEPEKDIWYNIDLPQMTAAKAGVESEFYIEAKDEEEPEEKIYPLALPKKIQLYNQHMQYVITWFGMSIALLLMYYFRFFHKSGKATKDEGDEV